MPYPLLLRPIFMPKVWGGRRMERLGKRLPPNENIGESWELADLGATSASGAGGGAARSIIENGELAGKTLHDAVLAWGPSLLGSRITPEGNFPLLVKFLDARENLSVQVHPSPGYAKANPGANLKTECWFILDAAPGAVIYKGVKPGVTAQMFERHVRESLKDSAAIHGFRGTETMPDASPRIVSDLVAVPAIPGECHNLPSGTVHALGAGVLVAEVQTPSDTTFRVYDWGRVGRELHVDQAMKCIDFGPAPGATRAGESQKRARLVTTEYFKVDHVRLAPGESLTLAHECHTLIVLSGEAEIAWEQGKERIATGRTLICPAAAKAQLAAAVETRLLHVTL